MRSLAKQCRTSTADHKMHIAIFKSPITVDVATSTSLCTELASNAEQGKQECPSFCSRSGENPPKGKEDRWCDLQTWPEEFVAKTVNTICMHLSQSTSGNPTGRGGPDDLNFKSGFHAAWDEKVRKLQFFAWMEFGQCFANFLFLKGGNRATI